MRPTEVPADAPFRSRATVFLAQARVQHTLQMIIIFTVCC